MFYKQVLSGNMAEVSRNLSSDERLLNLKWLDEDGIVHVLFYGSYKLYEEPCLKVRKNGFSLNSSSNKLCALGKSPHLLRFFHWSIKF